MVNKSKMIRLESGDLLQANAEAIVNTVNTVGVAGKGIALQVKRAFPQVNAQYERAAKKKLIVPGRVQVVPTNRLHNPRFVINFPTKRHWKGKARLQDIDDGLVDLARAIRELNIKSIAIPPLGCGNGGLDWNEVRPRIVSALHGLVDVDIRLYSPDGAPDPGLQEVNTPRPRLTPLRAALVRLIEDYAAPGYKLGLLEVQKLAYFWDRAAGVTDLEFAKNQYGPYSEKLNFVLQTLEGHFIRGYGDRTGRASIHPLPGAVDQANAVLNANPDSQLRVIKVLSLIQGFETPYGMELLSTVHWASTNDPNGVPDTERCIDLVHAWNRRKRELMRPDHIRIAWSRLLDEGWLPSSLT